MEELSLLIQDSSVVLSDKEQHESPSLRSSVLSQQEKSSVLFMESRQYAITEKGC